MSYTLLPFRFEKLNSSEVFLSNEVGEHIYIAQNDFNQLVDSKLDRASNAYKELKSKQFIADRNLDDVTDMLAIKYRTKKNFLNDFTSLHMLVPTLRCNSNCKYCQASRKDLQDVSCDMDKATARKVVDLIFCSPSSSIKIEFQGGEPLLNFKIIKYVIEYAEWKNVFKKKDLQFVICTNLCLMEEKMLKYLRHHRVYISTSLDGPKQIHNANRPLQDNDNSYDILIDKVNLCRKYLGKDSVSALMTASSNSLGRFKEIVDEYIRQDFRNIFFRSLNPYGFAEQEKDTIGYTIEKFIDSYKEGLEYIIEKNFEGCYIQEGLAWLLLTRILTPFSTGFVDLQSPAGVAISGVIYDYNGNMYVADEGRMLAAMGDQKFLMGNVHEKDYKSLFTSNFVKNIISNACLESLPTCAYCAYQSYCGADPVRNYSEQQDIIGRRYDSNICKKNKAIIKYLLSIIKNDEDKINKVLWSWLTFGI